MKNDICGEACACTKIEPAVAMAATVSVGISLHIICSSRPPAERRLAVSPTVDLKVDGHESITGRPPNTEGRMPNADGRPPGPKADVRMPMADRRVRRPTAECRRPKAYFL
jgi:hypothetical protein